MAKLIKHRGLYNKNILENTYTAIKNALDSDKYVGVEFDVRETLDKEFIIFHNPLVNGKLISNSLKKDLPAYIPRLKDVLKINSDKIFLIELKNIKHIANLISLLNKYPEKKFYVMSFSNNLIDKINVSSRNYKIGILNYVLNTNKEIKNYDFVGILNSILNDNIRKTLKDKEIFSYGFTEKIKYPDIFYIVD